MVRVTRDGEIMQGRGDYFVRPYGCRWLVVERGRRIVGEYVEKPKAVQVAAYMNGDLPGADDAGWDRVLDAVLAKEGAA